MEKVVYENSPSVPVVVLTGRSITRVSDFDDRKTGKPVHIERRVLQASFSDALDCPTVCCCVPVNGWKLDVSALERKNLKLCVTRFELDKSGACVFWFCGYEVLEQPRK